MKMKKIMRSTFGRLLCKNWVLAATLLVCGTCSLYAQTEGNTVRALPKVSIDNVKGTLTQEEPVEATITITYSGSRGRFFAWQSEQARALLIIFLR